jgi:hypothetical protein
MGVWWPEGVVVRRYRLLLIVGAAITVALVAWAWLWHRPARYESLDATLERYGYPRETLVRPPDGLGPYAVIGVVVGHESSPISGSFEANGQRRAFAVPAEKGVFFEVVGLEPADGGRPTFAVLRRPVVKSGKQQE